jgi:hypothetical protein
MTTGMQTSPDNTDQTPAFVADIQASQHEAGFMVKTG